MKTKEISFDTTKEEMDLINKIAKRAVKMAKELEFKYSMMDAGMDITACHANGCKLRLKELLKTDNSNFSHDVFGIRRHLNHQTGQLENYFLPRFAAKAQAR